MSCDPFHRSGTLKATVNPFNQVIVIPVECKSTGRSEKLVGFRVFFARVADGEERYARQRDACHCRLTVNCATN